MNGKGFILGFVFLLMAFAVTYAQYADISKPQILIKLEQMEGQSGQVEIIQPVQVENLLRMQIANNRQQKGIPGYRIHIFSKSGQTAQQKANETRRNFMGSFPEIDTYLEYQTPNFLIIVGDFRTKNQARRELKKIKKLYPGAFIVSETINISK